MQPVSRGVVSRQSGEPARHVDNNQYMDRKTPSHLRCPGFVVSIPEYRGAKLMHNLSSLYWGIILSDD